MRRIPFSRLLPAAPFSVAVAVVATLLGSPAARAVEDVTSPRSFGIGNALRADASGALGPLINPAGMTLKRGYNIELFYGLEFQNLGNQLNVSIVDSITSRVAVGVYYTFVYSKPHVYPYPLPGTAIDTSVVNPPNGTREGHEFGLSVALPIGDYFSIGVTAKYLTLNTQLDIGIGGAAYTIDTTTGDNAIARGFTGDVGLIARLGDKFNVGVIGYNLVPLRSVEAPIGLGIGLALKPTPNFLLAADTVIQFNQYEDFLAPFARETTARLGGGMEWVISGKVPLRLGYLWDSGKPAHYFSGGLGYQGEKFAVDLSYRQQFAYGAESLLIAGLRIFLQ